MTFTERVYKFLQVDKLQCANDGKKLSPLKGYYKMSMWPQYAYFTWRWLKQLYFGDIMVLRFCDLKCFNEFSARGQLGEIAK